MSVLALAGLALAPQLIAFSKDKVGFYGAFSSAADVNAMEWIKANSEPDARVLNYPVAHEGDWVPVISERDSVYFRPQPFFRGTEQVEAEQAALRAFWANPADPANADLLREHHISFVIVPQIVTDPNSIETMVRWHLPVDDPLVMASPVSAAPYLEQVFAQDGAEVYRVLPSGGS